MSDFLPKLSSHTVCLFPMLKKNPPAWTKVQTNAVKEIKKLADVMPPLKIPTVTDKRILQTDASDDYWGAVLLVEDTSSQRSICGYKSGTFKPSEQHYHSTFKEILAVKRGIEKFQFHLIGYDFQIEMDMASFPRMLHFKRKMLPEAQLLRWANWFSQWKFTVKHIKGTENVLADFLSRPKHYKCKEAPASEPPPQIIKMVFPLEGVPSPNNNTSAPHCVPSSSNNAITPQPLPAITDLIQELPESIREEIAELTVRQRAGLNYKVFLTILLRNHGLFMKGLRIHPDYPFLNVFHIHELYRFPKEAMVFFWYLFEAHTVCISFNAVKLQSYVYHNSFAELPAPAKNLMTLLEWFVPKHYWSQQLQSTRKKYAVVMFRRPVSYHSASPPWPPYLRNTPPPQSTTLPPLSICVIIIFSIPL